LLEFWFNVTAALRQRKRSLKFLSAVAMTIITLFAWMLRPVRAIR
jgi:hypothetical protein